MKGYAFTWKFKRLTFTFTWDLPYIASILFTHVNFTR